MKPFLPFSSGALSLALWIVAAATAIGAHVGIVAIVMRDTPAVPVADSPPPAIMIELAPLPEAAIPDETEMGEQDENVEEIEEVTPEPVEPDPEPEPEVEPIPEATLPAARPEKRPDRHEPRKKARHDKPREIQPPRQARTRAAAETPASNRNAAPATAHGRGRAGISPARWQSQLMAHLERRKRYPRGARSRGEQGIAQVRFTIDAGGNVTSASLVSSSGFAELDREALDLVRRASPVPAPPPDVSRTIVAPLRFNIR